MRRQSHDGSTRRLLSMRLLVLHQNFPGQFGHLVKAWSQRPGWDVRALGRDTAPGLPGFKGLTRYRLAGHPHAQQHPYLRSMESAVLHGQQVARVLLDMKRQGFTPDTILAHPGWGESLYVKDVFPDVRLVHYCEWYYNPEGADLGFDPEFPITFDDRARVRSWNALHALNMTNCDAAVTPTHWQKSRHPEVFHPKITVQHEGIDTEGLGPDPNATIIMPSGVTLKAGDPVVTYVTRNLEQYRGFHIFMAGAGEAAAAAQDGARADRRRRRRELRQAAEGCEELAREDAARGQARCYEDALLGRVPRQQNIKVLQVSAAHVYLNNPFVLSWSLLEAMHCGALVLGSDTAPVQEVIRGEENGVLSTFFDLVRTSDCIDWALQRGAQTLVMRHRAQQLAAQHSPANSLSGYQAIVASMRPGAVDLTRLQPLSKSTHLPQELKELSWLS